MPKTVVTSSKVGGGGGGGQNVVVTSVQSVNDQNRMNSQAMRSQQQQPATHHKNLSLTIPEQEPQQVQNLFEPPQSATNSDQPESDVKSQEQKTAPRVIVLSENSDNVVKVQRTTPIPTIIDQPQTQTHANMQQSQMFIQQQEKSMPQTSTNQNQQMMFQQQQQNYQSPVITSNAQSIQQQQMVSEQQKNMQMNQYRSASVQQNDQNSFQFQSQQQQQIMSQQNQQQNLTYDNQMTSDMQMVQNIEDIYQKTDATEEVMIIEESEEEVSINDMPHHSDFGNTGVSGLQAAMAAVNEFSNPERSYISNEEAARRSGNQPYADDHSGKIHQRVSSVGSSGGGQPIMSPPNQTSSTMKDVIRSMKNTRNSNPHQVQKQAEALYNSNQQSKRSNEYGDEYESDEEEKETPNINRGLQQTSPREGIDISTTSEEVIIIEEDEEEDDSSFSQHPNNNMFDQIQVPEAQDQQQQQAFQRQNNILGDPNRAPPKKKVTTEDEEEYYGEYDDEYEYIYEEEEEEENLPNDIENPNTKAAQESLRGQVDNLAVQKLESSVQGSAASSKKWKNIKVVQQQKYGPSRDQSDRKSLPPISQSSAQQKRRQNTHSNEDIKAVTMVEPIKQEEVTTVEPIMKFEPIEMPQPVVEEVKEIVPDEVTGIQAFRMTSESERSKISKKSKGESVESGDKVLPFEML